jgi:plasmid stabilization system protein ParE
MNIRFLTPADQEVDDAVAWYKQQGKDASRGFLDELDHAVRLVKTYPLLARLIEPEIRRFLFISYPYGLIYGMDEDTVVIIAGMNYPGSDNKQFVLNVLHWLTGLLN